MYSMDDREHGGRRHSLQIGVSKRQSQTVRQFSIALGTAGQVRLELTGRAGWR